jgi:hypothetical protein
LIQEDKRHPFKSKTGVKMLFQDNYLSVKEERGKSYFEDRYDEIDESRRDITYLDNGNELRGIKFKSEKGATTLFKIEGYD